LQQLEPRRLGEIRSPDVADDDLGLGQRGHHSLHVAEIGKDGRVQFFRHLANDAWRHTRGKSAEKQCFHVLLKLRSS
jgi:hypothetical protein